MQSVPDKSHKGERQLNLSTLEKGVVALIVSLSMSMLAWVTVTTNDTATKVAVMETSIEFIREDARAASDDRFTGTDAKELVRRVEDLEQLHERK